MMFDFRYWQRVRRRGSQRGPDYRIVEQLTSKERSLRWMILRGWL